MEKWEYLTVELDRITEKPGALKPRPPWDTKHITAQLNTYGMQGWELVGFFYREDGSLNGSLGTQNTFATFKRRA